MRTLFVVSECVPFIKSGGLADVAGSLPKALCEIGHDVRVMLPLYAGIPGPLLLDLKEIAYFHVRLGWRNQETKIFSLTRAGIVYYFIDQPYYFKREELYGHYDDGERFAYFCAAVMECIERLDFHPEVVHCHDWHTAMVPYLILNRREKYNRLHEIRTVFTIHNLKFQGIFAKECASDFFDLESYHLTAERLEFFGGINYMKAGIVAADFVTTVSPTYRNEIQTEYFGEKLDSVLRKYAYKLYGILNGIDYDFYNPEKDTALVKNYTVETFADKKVNKKALQKELKLPIKPNTPMLAMITRMTRQKGLDLLKHMIHELLQNEIRLVVLGTGDFEYESFFKYIEANFKQKAKVMIGFDEGLAHRIYAGADMFLMPSLFEPCGLSQLISLRYGTIPVVREIGGLKDTVRAYDETFFPSGNGFTFHDYNAHDFYYQIQKGLRCYDKPKVWKQIIENAMKGNYSWDASAKAYEELYQMPVPQLMG